MTDQMNHPNRRRLFPFRRHGKQISGHESGDIRSDEPVIIHEDAVLVGNLAAPQIHVAGLLYGTAVTPSLVLESSGQIWGDVYASSLQIKPGGVIQGWVSSPVIETDTTIGAEPPAIQEPDLPDDLARQAPPPHNNLLADAWQQLQASAGKALTDYARLKQQFNEQLAEKTETAVIQSEKLAKELMASEARLAELQQQLTELQAALAARETELGQQEAALAAANEQTSQQQRQLEELNSAHTQLTQQLKELQDSNNSLELTLAKTEQQVDKLNDQIKTLETTLQDSIQRTTEQEDALIHWQELASSNQIRLGELEKEKENLERQLEESTLANDRLREKNSRLDFEWQQALKEMDELRNRIPDATVEEMHFALGDARQQIATLNSIIEESKGAAAETDEQLIWYKANLKTMQHNLEQSRQIAQEQETMLVALKTEAANKESELNHWKSAVEEMTSQLQDREQQIAKLESGLAEKDALLEAETARLKEELRHKLAQVEANEEEIEHHLQQMDAQGQHLAEIQAALVERELQLERAIKKITRQSDFIKRMRRVTSGRIELLEKNLKEAQGKLQETTRER